MRCCISCCISDFRHTFSSVRVNNDEFRILRIKEKVCCYADISLQNPIRRKKCFTKFFARYTHAVTSIRTYRTEKTGVNLGQVFWPSATQLEENEILKHVESWKNSYQIDYTWQPVEEVRFCIVVVCLNCINCCLYAVVLDESTWLLVVVLEYV